MIFKELPRTNDNDEKIYARINDDGTSNYSCVLEDPLFQEWLAEGNEPLPADEPQQSENP